MRQHRSNYELTRMAGGIVKLIFFTKPKAYICDNLIQRKQRPVGLGPSAFAGWKEGMIDVTVRLCLQKIQDILQFTCIYRQCQMLKAFGIKDRSNNLGWQVIES